MARSGSSVASSPLDSQAWTPAIPDLRLADGHVIRDLPPNEWGRLAETSGPFAGVGLPPTGSCRVLVIENDKGVIVAHWPAFDAIHLDGLWKHPDYRHRAQLDRIFLGAMVTLLQTKGVRYAFAVIRDADIPTSGALAETLGFADQGRVYGGEIPAFTAPAPADPEDV